MDQSLQGSLQCCVTGPAFEQMLEQADASVVHAVMSSAAVFARMRGQQKGQVMNLLGRQGLFRTLQGEQHHLLVSIPFPFFSCINTLCVCVVYAHADCDNLKLAFRRT